MREVDRTTGKLLADTRERQAGALFGFALEQLALQASCARKTASTFTSVKLGGGQIEFEDEDPQIYRDFEAAMKLAGGRCNMGSYHPGCTYK